MTRAGVLDAGVRDAGVRDAGIGCAWDVAMAAKTDHSATTAPGMKRIKIPGFRVLKRGSRLCEPYSGVTHAGTLPLG